jgi:hypothetical protein
MRPTLSFKQMTISVSREVPMNDSFSRLVCALLAVWAMALVPLLLLDRDVPRVVASLVSVHAQP